MDIEQDHEKDGQRAVHSVCLLTSSTALSESQCHRCSGDKGCACRSIRKRWNAVVRTLQTVGGQLLVCLLFEACVLALKGSIEFGRSEERLLAGAGCAAFQTWLSGAKGFPDAMQSTALGTKCVPSECIDGNHNWRCSTILSIIQSSVFCRHFAEVCVLLFDSKLPRSLDN